MSPFWLLTAWQGWRRQGLATFAMLCLCSCGSGSRDPVELAGRLEQVSAPLAELSEHLNRIPDDSYWGSLANPLRAEADALNDGIATAIAAVADAEGPVSEELADRVATLVGDGEDLVSRAVDTARMMTTMEHVRWSGVAPVFGAARDQSGRPVFLVLEVETGVEVVLVEGDEFGRATVVPGARTGVSVGDEYFRFHAAAIAYLGSGDSARLQMLDNEGDEIGTLSATHEVTLGRKYSDLFEAAASAR